MESIIYLFRQLHWYDVLDIMLVTYFIVWLYSWVKQTRAFRVLLGLGLLLIVYVWAQLWNLFLTTWAFQVLGQATLIFVIIIFAPEIRQVLERLNPLRIWNPKEEHAFTFIPEMMEALEHFRRFRIGALIVLERSDPLRELVRPGIPLGGEMRREILVSIFQPNSPTHDGAVWVRHGRIHEVGVFLPISTQADVPSYYGSRHRAAMGITELSDALVLIVSEERGEIGLAEEGRLRHIEDLSALAAEIGEKLHQVIRIRRPTSREIFLREWKVKLITLLFVASVWFALAGQQQSEQIYSVPIQYTGVPARYTLADPSTDEASIRVAGTRRDLARLDSKSFRVRIDLSRVSAGTSLITLDRSNISAPDDVMVTEVRPASVPVRLEPKK